MIKLFKINFTPTIKKMSDDSDYEGQIDERQIQDLQDKVKLLESENKNLKQQFEQAVQMTSLVKELRQKNEELNSSVRKLQRENEDITHRFEILEKTNEENIEKLNEERKKAYKQNTEESERSKKENEHIKTLLSQQVAKLQQALYQSEQEKKDQEVEIKKVMSEQEKMLSCASYYLQEEFNSIADLASFFEEKQQANETLNTQVKPETRSPTKQPGNDEMKRKYKSAMNKLKNAQETISTLEIQVAESNKRVKDQEMKHTLKMQEYEEKIKQLKEESELKDNDHEHQITILNNKVDTLKSNLQKTKTMRESSILNTSQNQTQTMLQQSQLQTPVRSPVKSSMKESTVSRKSIREEKKSQDVAFDQMAMRNSELSDKLHAAEAKKDTLAEQLIQAQKEKQELELNSEKQKHSLNVLTAVHNETIAELEAVHKALSTLSPIKERANKAAQQKKAKESAQLRDKVSSLEKTIQQQNDEIDAANSEAIKAKTELAQLTAHANQLEEELKNYDEQIKKLNAAVYEAESKYQNKPTATEEDIIPISAWRYAGFNKELASQINQIAQNESLQAATKLQTAFKTIKQYFDKIISSSDDDADKIEKEFSAFKRIVDKFVVDVTIAATGTPVTMEEFIETEGSDIVKNISILRHTYDDLVRRYNTLLALVNQYKETFCENPDDDVSSSIISVKQTLDQKKADLENRNKRVKELKSILEQYQKKVTSDKKLLTEENNDLKQKIEELLSKNNTINDELSSLKRRNHELTKLVREAREQNEQLETTIIENQDEAAQSAAEEITKLDQSLRQEIKATEDRLNQTSEELEDATEEIEKLRGVILSQRKAMDELRAQTNDEKEVLNQTINDNENKFNEEKEHIIQTYEEAIAEIKKQSEIRRQDIERLTEDVKNGDKANKESSKKLSQLKREKKNLEEDLRVAKESYDRQNRLNDSKHLTEMMQLEANYTARSNEQLEQFEKEKIQLFSFAATELKQLFPTKQNIDERSYKALISKAHSELDRLNKSDSAIRRITKAADRQTTEDAVMQLLL